MQGAEDRDITVLDRRMEDGHINSNSGLIRLLSMYSMGQSPFWAFAHKPYTAYCRVVVEHARACIRSYVIRVIHSRYHNSLGRIQHPSALAHNVVTSCAAPFCASQSALIAATAALLKQSHDAQYWLQFDTVQLSAP